MHDRQSRTFGRPLRRLDGIFLEVDDDISDLEVNDIDGTEATLILDDVLVDGRILFWIIVDVVVDIPTLADIFIVDIFDIFWVDINSSSDSLSLSRGGIVIVEVLEWVRV